MVVSVMMLIVKFVNMVKNFVKYILLFVRFELLLIVFMCSGRLIKYVIRFMFVKLVINNLFGVKLLWWFLKINVRIIEFVMILRKYDVFKVVFCVVNFGYWWFDFLWFDFLRKNVWFVIKDIFVFFVCVFWENSS